MVTLKFSECFLGGNCVYTRAHLLYIDLIVNDSFWRRFIVKQYPKREFGSSAEIMGVSRIFFMKIEDSPSIILALLCNLLNDNTLFSKNTSISRLEGVEK